MKMTVTRHWPAIINIKGETVPPREDSCTGESGWDSVEEMQRELLKRHHPRCHPVKIENGIQHDLSHGIIQTVTLHG